MENKCIYCQKNISKYAKRCISCAKKTILIHDFNKKHPQNKHCKVCGKQIDPRNKLCIQCYHIFIKVEQKICMKCKAKSINNQRIVYYVPIKGIEMVTGKAECQNV